MAEANDTIGLAQIGLDQMRGPTELAIIEADDADFAGPQHRQHRRVARCDADFTLPRRREYHLAVFGVDLALRGDDIYVDCRHISFLSVSRRRDILVPTQSQQECRSYVKFFAFSTASSIVPHM